MAIVVVVIVILLAFFGVNWKTRKTNAYNNFYRTIHVVKDVTEDEKYKYAAFGSTFAYYAYDLKNYNGHNFSIEPQSITYMKKTIEHFKKNIKKDGYALISLTGCFFAATSTTSDEKCITYQAFLKPDEFDNYSKITKIKYYLKRYLPALSPYYIKCNIKDEPLKYSINKGITYGTGEAQAGRRIKGWEKVVEKPINESFSMDDKLEARLQENIDKMREIIKSLRECDIKPVFVVLPMSQAFNNYCPGIFYDEILYWCLHILQDEGVMTLDYLYDEELNKMDYYMSADCLNMTGRKLLTEKIITTINNASATLKPNLH